MTLDRFRASLAEPEPPTGLDDLGRALWYAGRDEWALAHDIVERDVTSSGAAVHAYLHRVEGDAWNADYWYRRAGREPFDGAAEEEWAALVGEIS